MKFKTKLMSLIALSCINMAHGENSPSLNLSTTLQHAIANDPQWAAKVHAHAANREIRPLASAGLKPTLKLNAQSSREHYESDTFGTDSYDLTTYGANLVQPLFRLDRWYSYKKGTLISQQKDAEFIQAQLDFYMRVVDVYFGVLSAEENRRFRRAEKSAIQQQLKQTEQRFNVGLVAEADVQEARAAFDISSVQFILAEQALDLALESLNTLTGMPVETIAPLKSDIPMALPLPNDVTSWKTMALDHNPQLKAALLNKGAARRDFQAKTAAHLPSVDLFGNYQNSDRYIPTTQGEMESNSVGIKVEMPLYAGGAVSASRRQSKQVSLQAEDEFQFIERDIIQKTNNLYRVVSSDVARVAAQKQSIRSATAAYEASKIGYKTGTRTIVDLLTAQQALFSVKRDYANARFEYIFDSLKLKQIAGVLSEKDINDVNNWLENR